MESSAVPSGVSASTASSSGIRFPIEGETPWPGLIRVVTFGSFVCIVLALLVLLIIVPPGALGFSQERLMLGLTCVFAFEVVIIRRLIVPMNGDYGRFRINPRYIDLYPLTALGLRVHSRSQQVSAADYKGVRIDTMAAKGSDARYIVTLVHPERANMIQVKIFSTLDDAKAYAGELAAAMNLPVLP